MFLAAYRKCGKVGKAAEASGLTRWAAIHWQRHDIFSFNRRLEAVHEDYCEYWEAGIDERLENPQGNRGSDILYMFKMKAEKPGKYRENVQITTDAPVKQMLEQMRQIELQQQKAASTGSAQGLEQGASEGEFRVCPEPVEGDLGEKGEN
jgi:hypothetical protein